MKFHKPILGGFNLLFVRIGGPGLGNLLFPLYRAYVAAKEDPNGKFLFPAFFQIKFGPILRGEQDKRLYFRLFRFDINDALCWILSSIPLRLIPKMSNGEYEYSGLGDYFISLDGRYRQDFTNMLLARYRFRSFLDALRINDCIAVHVRLGDFASNSLQSCEHGMSIKNSEGWYKHAISKLVGSKKKLIIFTDEPESEYIKTNFADCEIDHSKDAFEAIYKMSCCDFIIGSNSSFSMWAAFLGGKKLYVNKSFAIERYACGNSIRYEKI